MLQNPDYMKDDFFIQIETIHLPDRGINPNAHSLSVEELDRRDVIRLDIADDSSYLNSANR
ncbi:unnamed protein product [Gongylonema pulchrum]|uniref:Cadherin domain-containing protein n=1 Tax=Gongylonema pulchrum TaxID=637853 RepID=A0A183D8D7_9BILA|nr:unnamed protein product [Gongylonema pulchrum]